VSFCRYGRCCCDDDGCDRCVSFCRYGNGGGDGDGLVRSGGWGGGGANGGDDWSRGSANGGGVESDRIIPNPGPGHVENVVTIPRESRRNRDHPEPRILTPVTWKSRSVAE